MTFPKYEAYKDSGVEWLGEVPKHWKLICLRWLIQTNSGDFISNTEIERDPTDNETIPVVGGNGVMAYTSRKNTSKNTIVVGRVGAHCGNVHLLKANSWVTDNALRISFLSDETYPEYIFKLFRALNFNDSAHKNAQPLITGETIKSQYIALPSIAEQTQIARFLDHETARIDALIVEQERLIELLKEKRQAVISHAVTKGCDSTVPMKDSGVEWLGEVPAHWEVKKVAYACEIHNNLRTPIDRDIRAQKSGPYPYYGPTGILDYIDEFYVEGEYFLLGEDGDHFLKFDEKPMTFRVNGKFCVNNHAHLLRGKKGCSTDWASLCFETRDLSPWLIKQGVARYKLRKEILANIPIAVPPLLEQAEILEHVNSQKTMLNTVIKQSEESIKLLQERRSALISAAVTGKIDVRDWQPPTSDAPAATLEAAYG